jgi:hypothetical protein
MGVTYIGNYSVLLNSLSADQRWRLIPVPGWLVSPDVTTDGIVGNGSKTRSFGRHDRHPTTRKY